MISLLRKFDPATQSPEASALLTELIANPRHFEFQLKRDGNEEQRTPDKSKTICKQELCNILATQQICRHIEEP